MKQSKIVQMHENYYNYYEHKIQVRESLIMNKFKEGRINLLWYFIFLWSSYKRNANHLAFVILKNIMRKIRLAIWDI